MTRRQLGLSVAVSALPVLAVQEKPALLGGPKTRQFVKQFELAYAKLTGSKEVLVFCNGTSALCGL